MIGQTSPKSYHEALKTAANACTYVRDQAYDIVNKTPLGLIVDRISDFLRNNAALVQWGGAIFFAAAGPTFFVPGFAVGVAVGSLIPYDPSSFADIDFKALKQTVNTIIFIAGMCMGPGASFFISGYTPGFHTYRVWNGYYTNIGLKGPRALEFELDSMCWELAQWIPGFNPAAHPQLAKIKANKNLLLYRA